MPTTDAFHTQWQPDGETFITVFFGTFALILGVVQMIFGWQSLAAMRGRAGHAAV